MKFRQSTVRRAIIDHLGQSPATAWHYGLDIMRATHTLAGWFFPAIYELESRGIVEARWTQPNARGYRRREYRLTNRDAALADIEAGRP